MTWTQQQYNIPPFDFGLWASYTGTGFAQLTENDFKQRIPQVCTNAIDLVLNENQIVMEMYCQHQNNLKYF